MAEENLTIVSDNTDKIAKTIRELSKARVLIGIPSDSEKNQRQAGDKMTNAQLGYLHEYGAPANNLPARPFLVPGVTNSKSKWTSYLQQAGKAAFEGKPAIVDGALNAAGLTAMNAVKDRISSNIPPPLSPHTIAARLAAHPPAAGETPNITALIDTAQMINSITYVIERRK